MIEKILVVDDDPLVLRTLELFLTQEGLDVTAAVSGPDAVQKASDDYYRLIIMDMRMPGMAGVETAEIIQSVYAKKGRAVNFIFITGYAEDDVPAHALRLGITDVLLKPLDLHQMLKRVHARLADDHADADAPPLYEAAPSLSRWTFPGREFVYEKLITVKDINLEGNVYFSNFFLWQGEAREALLLEHPSFKKKYEESRHIKMITHSAYQRFLHESHFGEKVKIKITSREIKKCSFILVFRFFNASDQVFLAEGWQRIAFAYRESGKICPTPQYLLDLVVPIEECEPARFS